MIYAFIFVSSDNFLYWLIQIQPQILNEKTAQMSFTTKLSLRFLRQLLDSTKDLLSDFVKGGMLEVIRSTLYYILCILRAVWQILSVGGSGKSTSLDQLYTRHTSKVLLISKWTCFSNCVSSGWLEYTHVHVQRLAW